MNVNKREEQRQLWISRLCDLEESGMTQNEWCANHNIPYSTLRYWIAKLRKETDANTVETNWLKVDMSAGTEVATLKVPEKEKNDDSYMIIRFGDFTIELHNGCDQRQFFEVLKVMKAI
ncbi:MAG: IS66 family insertion sequence element accessory protein TnpA [Anaerovoracaceae bacterium]